MLSRDLLWNELISLVARDRRFWIVAYAATEQALLLAHGPVGSSSLISRRSGELTPQRSWEPGSDAVRHQCRDAPNPASMPKRPGSRSKGTLEGKRAEAPRTRRTQGVITPTRLRRRKGLARLSRWPMAQPPVGRRPVGLIAGPAQRFVYKVLRMLPAAPPGVVAHSDVCRFDNA